MHDYRDYIVHEKLHFQFFFSANAKLKSWQLFGQLRSYLPVARAERDGANKKTTANT